MRKAVKKGPLSYVERTERRKAQKVKRQMLSDARAAFSDLAMVDHASLLVWTRGQMNGVRATIKRLRMV